MMSTPLRVRKAADIDREIEEARRVRGRLVVQIDEHLRGVATLRSKYARAGARIDELLDERLALTGGD